MKFTVRSTWRVDTEIDTTDIDDLPDDFDPWHDETWPIEVWEQVTTSTAELVDWETTRVEP